MEVQVEPMIERVQKWLQRCLEIKSLIIIKNFLSLEFDLGETIVVQVFHHTSRGEEVEIPEHTPRMAAVLCLLQLSSQR